MQKVILLVLISVLTACTTQNADQTDETVPQSAYDIQPLLIGEQIPDMTMTDKDDREHSLRELIAQQPAVIVFYRGGWCPFCSSYLGEVAAMEDEIYELGYQILAISPDQPQYLRESVQEVDINYTLLSDSSMEVARAFGLAFRVDDETVEELKNNGMDIVKNSGHDHRQLPVPAAFITDTSGEILFQYVNPEYRERISGDILKSALREYRE